MSAAFAIGVGCRRDCVAGAIVAVIEQASALCDGAPGARVYSVVDKQNEAGLQAAARMLQRDLVFVSREKLQDVADRVATHSASERILGVPSVAESAALVGAGPSSRLIVTRIAKDGATCAIAIRGEGP
jgi:cobalt-precorrin 5A hydrolase